MSNPMYFGSLNSNMALVFNLFLHFDSVSTQISFFFCTSWTAKTERFRYMTSRCLIPRFLGRWIHIRHYFCKCLTFWQCRWTNKCFFVHLERRKFNVSDNFKVSHPIYFGSQNSNLAFFVSDCWHFYSVSGRISGFYRQLMAKIEYRVF